jgi:hypothetical protein
MKEQTAVEWLVEQICGHHTEQWQKEIEQAKEMEKEQIKNAWIATDNELQRIAAEEYYNRTYNL